MSDDEPTPSDAATDGSPRDHTVTDEPLSPSAIAQFVRHDRCPRYLKQKCEPGSEPEAREWREAFNLMNVALLGSGQEFEATQVEALAANASRVIGPADDDTTKVGVPDIEYDKTWAASPEGRSDQLQAAANDVATQPTDTDNPGYILCYQAPLGGHVGDFDLWGEIDCLVFTPQAATNHVEQTDGGKTTTPSDVSHAGSTGSPSTPEPAPTQPAHTASDASVVARVLEIKSARKRKPAHHVQVAIYSTLLEQTLRTEATPGCRIETGILTQTTAVESGDSLSPFAVPTFQRDEWEFYVEQLLAAGGPVETTLQTDLDELPFALDRVCNNCAYQEACATRAVENPTTPASLALLGLPPSVQGRLQNAGVTNIQQLSELLPPQRNTDPTDEPPTFDLPAEKQRDLEELLPGSIHETVLQAQALRSEVDPGYPA